MNRKLQHRFYQKTKRAQITFLVIIALLTLLVTLLSVYIAWRTGLYLIGVLIVPIVISIIAPFFDTPSMRKSGRLIYYSSLFITEKPANGKITVHGGTLFDYVFVLKRSMTGKERTTYIIQQYIEGLLNFIAEYEKEEIREIKVKGTSYILNERTARKIGFKVVETDFTQKIILVYNYFNLMISNSIAKAKFTLPNLKNIKTYETDIKSLIDHKKEITAINNQMKRITWY